MYLRFVDAILEPERRTQYLQILTEQQQTENMHEVYTKYGQPNVIAGIDRCHIPLENVLEKYLEVMTILFFFINRKGLYSINAQIVGGIDRKLYDIQLTSPGSYHDAAMYQFSMSTRNTLGGFVLGDSAYPLSKFCITPYDENGTNDHNRCLFKGILRQGWK